MREYKILMVNYRNVFIYQDFAVFVLQDPFLFENMGVFDKDESSYIHSLSKGYITKIIEGLFE